MKDKIIIIKYNKHKLYLTEEGYKNYQEMLNFRKEQDKKLLYDK